MVLGVHLLKTLLLLVQKHVTFIGVAYVDPILLVHQTLKFAENPYQLLLDYLVFELAVGQRLLKFGIVMFADSLNLFGDLLQPLTIFVEDTDELIFVL